MLDMFLRFCILKGISSYEGVMNRVGWVVWRTLADRCVFFGWRFFWVACFSTKLTSQSRRCTTVWCVCRHRLMNNPHKSNQRPMHLPEQADSFTPEVLSFLLDFWNQISLSWLSGAWSCTNNLGLSIGDIACNQGFFLYQNTYPNQLMHSADKKYGRQKLWETTKVFI